MDCDGPNGTAGRGGVGYGTPRPTRPQALCDFLETPQIRKSRKFRNFGCARECRRRRRSSFAVSSPRRQQLLPAALGAMIRCCCCVDRFAGEVAATMTDAEWVAFEMSVKAPMAYDPPQKRTFNDCINCPLRTPCPCCMPCVRTLCFCGLGSRRVSLHQPDKWFAEMLQQRHPKCPKELTGIWWMKDPPPCGGDARRGFSVVAPLLRGSASIAGSVARCRQLGVPECATKSGGDCPRDSSPAPPAHG